MTASFFFLSKLAFANTHGQVCISKCQKKEENRNEKWQENIINFCGYILALKFECSSKTIMTQVHTNETKVKLSNLHNEHKLSTGCQTKLTEKLKPTYVQIFKFPYMHFLLTNITLLLKLNNSEITKCCQLKTQVGFNFSP